MTLNGVPYAPRDPREARNAGVAMIYQELSLAPHMSVMDNIALGLEPARQGVLGSLGILHRDAMRETARTALAQLGHSDIPVDAPVGELSPAAQQLVEIARALACGCRVLVLDEPTSSLAHGDVRKLFELIGRLKQQGLAIVYISHFIEEVTEVSDRFVVLRDGRNAGEGVTSQTSGDRIVSLMVGRTLDDLYPRWTARDRRTASPVGGTLARTNGSGLVHAAPRRDFRHRRSAWRRTHPAAARACSAWMRCRSGSVKLALHTGPIAPADWWRHGMGMLSEDRTGEGLATNLNVADNLTMTRLEGPVRGVFRLAGPATQQREAMD